MTKPTIEDATLFLQLFAIMQNDKDLGNAYEWLENDLDTKNYEAFKVKYLKGSMGRRNIGIYAGYMEILSTFVNHGLLNEDLIFDLWGDLFWSRLGPIVQGLREEMKYPRLYENYELLAKKYRKWTEEHPIKI